MIPALLRVALVAAVVFGLAAGWVASRRSLVSVPASPPRQAPDARQGHDTVPIIDSAVARASGRPLFRADRHASPTPFTADAPSGGQAESPPPAPRPSIALSGIVWGADPAAVLEGVPGSEASTVLRVGETVSGLRVLRIGQERVVVAGFDTTWTLTVRQPWQ